MNRTKEPDDRRRIPVANLSSTERSININLTYQQAVRLARDILVEAENLEYEDERVQVCSLNTKQLSIIVGKWPKLRKKQKV